MMGPHYNWKGSRLFSPESWQIQLKKEQFPILLNRLPIGNAPDVHDSGNHSESHKTS